MFAHDHKCLKLFKHPTYRYFYKVLRIQTYSFYLEALGTIPENIFPVFIFPKFEFCSASFLHWK